MKSNILITFLLSSILLARVSAQDDNKQLSVKSEKQVKSEYVIPQYLLDKVKEGDAEIAYFIATTLFEESENINSDYDRGMQWLEKAAEMGEPHAMFDLAEEYDFKSEKEKALVWLEKAADKELASAYEMLGTYHYKGYAGLKKDCQKAYGYFETAQLKNDEEAYNNHAWLLATSKDKQCRNPEKALKLIYDLMSIYGEEPVPFYVMDTQAAVLASVSDFARAIKIQQSIIEQMQKMDVVNESYKERLESYKQRKALWIE